MAKKYKIPGYLSPEMRKFASSVLESYGLEHHHYILLIRAAELLDRAEQARKQVQTEGLTVTDRYGSIKPHPCYKIEIDCKSAARLLIRELGLDLEPPDEPGRPPRRY